MSWESEVSCDGKIVIFENLLSPSLFEAISALFRFQYPFLGHPRLKNNWEQKDDNVYYNYRMEETAKPSNSIEELKNKISDPEFITHILRDKLKLICLDITKNDILKVQVCGSIVDKGGYVKTHKSKYFTPDNEDEVFLKMILYTHDYWSSNQNGHLEYWGNGPMKSCYEPIPNRLIVFLSDNQSTHGTTPLIGDQKLCAVETFIKVSLQGK